jgi:hypothetical protein
MTRLHTLAAAAGLSSRVGVAGFPDDVADRICDLALQGINADDIVTALRAPVITTKYATRPLTKDDVQEIVTLVRQARAELVWREQEAVRAREACEQLRAALEPTPAAAATPATGGKAR